MRGVLMVRAALQWLFWFWARGCPPHAVCRGGRLLVPGAQQSHVCGRRRARTVDTRSKLWKAALTCLRECGSVQGAGTLRERASRTLGRDPVRPQLAYKSTSNLVNFPQSGRSGALSAVWQFSKLFRKPRPGTPTTRARAGTSGKTPARQHPETAARQRSARIDQQGPIRDGAARA